MKSIRSICIAVTLLCFIQVTLGRYCCGCCRKVGLCGGYSPAKYCAGSGCSIRKPYNGCCCVNCGCCCSCCPCYCCCCPNYDSTSTYSVDTTQVVPTVTEIATSPVVPTGTPGDTTTPVFLEDTTPVTQNVLDTQRVNVSVPDTPLFTETTEDI